MSDGAWQSLVAQTAAAQGSAGPTFHLDLLAQPTEARHARTFLRAQLSRLPQPPLDLVLLLATELVTNAMLHGRSGIGLDLSVFGGAIPAQATDAEVVGLGPAVLVGVTDGSPMVPRQRHRSRSKESGRGLQIVRELADEWGWLPLNDAPGKIVWFRVNAGSPQPKQRRRKRVADEESGLS